LQVGAYHRIPKNVKSNLAQSGRGIMYSLAREMVDWNRRKLNLPTSKNGEPLRIPYLNYQI